jgi:N utilization substance protein B
MAASRHTGRIVAMQALFQLDAGEASSEAGLSAAATENQASAEAADFAQRLVSGVLLSLPEIDRSIAQAAPQWPLDQIARVDLAILRLAVHELMHVPETPPKVVINEAIEIAKQFGSETSGRFVNGVLGHVLGALPGRLADDAHQEPDHFGDWSDGPGAATLE